MPRRLLAIALPFFLTLAVRAAPTTPTATPLPTDVPTLIQKLADADPDVRQSAAARLTDLGASVRPALMQAMESAAPEVRTRISQILLRRPWVGPNDAPDVQQGLTDYGQLDAEERCQRAQMLADLPNGAGQDALIRILQYDPSTAVRWQSAQVLRMRLNDNVPPFARLRNLPIDDQTTNIPLLATVGWAWHDVDAKRTDKFLTRAVAADAAHPAAMNGQLDFAYAWLVRSAMDDRRYDDAAALLRQQSSRASWDADSIPQPIASLFALHAQIGPISGFSADLHLYRSYLSRPEVLYCLAHLAGREGLISLDPLLNLTAISAGGTSPARHLQVGIFLTDQGWLESAQRELHIALLLCDASSTDQIVDIYFKLAQIAGELNDELATAQNLESALQHLAGTDYQLQRTTPMGDEIPWSVDDAWAEVHWHYLRAAQASNDKPALAAHLQKLLDLNKLGQVLHEDPGLASDVVPYLQQAGRTAEAENYFNSVYKDLSDELSAHPTDAEAMNNLAWLCARCNRRLTEAMKFADRAAAAEPDNSAYLDTDAECHFRAGDKADAIKLETRALQLTPNDTFMMGQLRRFRGESPHVSSHP
jgi:tetratricopeptide (TPR) repeat protein